MPKRQAQRIIDNRSANRNPTTISGITLTSPGTAYTAGDGLTLTGVVLAVGAGDGISVAADAVAVDSTVVRTTRTVTAGSGLTGGGALSADLTLNVGAGTLITVGADTVGITAGANYQFIGTGSGTTPEWRNVSELAGNGLTAANGVLAVGAGTLITVGADTVGITAGAAYQFVGTGSGTAAAWQNLSALAGNGLTHSAGVLAVGVSGLGLSVGADAVTLTSSSNPGAAASILATSAAGLVQLVQVASNATFASGFAGSGYRVDYGVTEASKASAEFDNLTVRGRMRVYELLIQQIRATNGSVFVTSTGKAKAVTASTDPTWTVNGSQLTFNGSNATLATALYTITTSDSTEDAASKSLYHGFLTGDLIRAQQTEWNGSAFAGVYQSDLEVTSVASLYAFTGARVSSGTSAAAVGYDYARLGSATDTTRQGTIYLTSDDSNAPFIDILDGVQAHSGWNASGNVKVRLGKLSGITDEYFGTLSGYGLYSDNVYLRGSIYATSGVFSGTVYASAGTFTGAITAASGSITGVLTIGTSGEIRQGTGTLGSNYTGLRIWRDGDVGRIGGYNANTLQWYAGTDGKFYAGAGAVSIDSDGISSVIQTSFDDKRGYRYTLSGSVVAGIWASDSYYDDQSIYLNFVSNGTANNSIARTDRDGVIELRSICNDTFTSIVQLIAEHRNPSHMATLTLRSEDTYTSIRFVADRIEADGAFKLIAVSNTPPYPSSAANIYVKSNKLIVQYRDGSTTRYKYLSLTGTDVAWVHTTTEP